MAQNQDLTNEGQDLSSKGQDTSQPLQNENSANSSNVKIGSEDNQGKTPLGHPKTTFGTQQEHNRSITEMPENQDLKKVFDAWKNLPEAMKQGILAMIAAAVKK
ncbi:MAG: hypothetical protein WAX69_21070 [Victivallales bacterium]